MRTMTNNKIFLSMAALAFVGAMMTGCSSEDLTAETPQSAKTGTVVMKTTISLSENASTRALTEAGVKTFAVGDQIAVIYKNTAGETVKAESAALEATDLINTQKAKFSVALTDPEPSTAVRYIYPASMAADDVSATTPDNDATIKWTNLSMQDGTLATLANDLDLAVFDGTLTAQAVLPAATLANPLTIGKFTIKNNATSDDVTNTITKLTIGDGTNTYTVNPLTLSTIYVAMKPVDNKTVTVSVTASTNKYSDKSISATTLAQNTMYPINVSLTARYPLALASVSTDDIGCVITTDGNICMNAAGATAASKTAVAMITYVGSANAESPPYNHGLALALSDANGGNICQWREENRDAGHTKQTDYTNFTSESGLQYNDATHNSDDYPTFPAFKVAMANNGTDAPTGCSAWFLPTAYQWNQMSDACKNVLGTKNSYEDLRDGFNNAGGTNLQSNWYWSSSEYDTIRTWCYNFFNGNFRLLSDARNHDQYVRSALAF